MATSQWCSAVVQAAAGHMQQVSELRTEVESCGLHRPAIVRPSQALSWSLALGPSLCVSSPATHSDRRNQTSFTVHAAWTRRSKGSDEPSKKKSWGQRAEKYMRPFMLDVYISKRYVSCKVTHRVTSKVVAVATTNARDLRESLRSLCDENACKVIAKLITQRSMEADVYSVKFQLRTNEKFEGKLALVVNSVVEEGLAVMV